MSISEAGMREALLVLVSMASEHELEALDQTLGDEHRDDAVAVLRWAREETERQLASAMNARECEGWSRLSVLEKELLQRIEAAEVALGDVTCGGPLEECVEDAVARLNQGRGGLINEVRGDV